MLARSTLLDSKTARMEAQARWRTYVAGLTDAAESPSDFTVAVAATFTAEGLVSLLGGELINAGYRPHMLLGAYNQLYQACIDPTSAFGEIPSAILLIWRIEDLLELQFRRFVLDGKYEGLDEAEFELASLADALATLRRNFKGAITVTLPLAPHTPYFEPHDIDAADGMTFFRRIASAWTEHVRRIGGIRMLDLDAIQRRLGDRNAYDARKWYLYRQPVSESFLFELAQQYRRIVVAERKAAAKCVVLDCDNTLWGGIIGEDGLAGIQIGQDFPGSAYRDFQAFLLGLRQRGILLALCTKNNERDVKEVFESHDGMMLRWADISAHRICWRPKSETVDEIAAELNIATDSLVFIDDNPFEIDEINSVHPEIRCIRLPEDSALLLTEVRSHDFFGMLDVTDEDRARADMIHVEKGRTSAAASMSKVEFLHSLELAINFERARSEHLGRVAQLINKTNQFNLNTKRRTPDEVQSLAVSEDHRIFVANVRDRFGDYGLVGVIIIHTRSRDVWEIDSFLLSCRVLGRGVEAALLALVASAAQAAGAITLRGIFVPSAKNAVASQFYSGMGFVQVGTTEWDADPSSILPPEPYLTINAKP